jgi:hypothetical protein
MARSVDARRGEVWRQRLLRFERAGLSVARFCERERVSVASFYGWRRKIGATQKRGGEGTAGQAAFAPVRLVGAVHVTVRWPGGTQIDIPLGDPRTREVFEWLRQVDAQQRTHDARAGGDAC